MRNPVHPLSPRIPGSRRGGVGRSATLAATVFALLAPTGCSDAERSTDPPVNELPALTLVEELRLGDVDDPDVGFSQPSSVAQRPDGTFAVVEAQGLQIRVYEADGTPLHRFGSRGEGPGEFGMVPSIGWVGDTLWAMDGGHERLTNFRADGTVLGAHRIETLEVPLPSGRGTIFPIVPREDGTLTGHLVRVMVRQDDPETGVAPGDRIPVPLVRYGLQGQVLDTLGLLDKPNPRIWSREIARIPEPDIIQLGDRRVRIPAPPPALPYFEGTDDGYVEFRAPTPSGGGVHEVEIYRVHPGSDTVWARSLRWRPVAYTAEDLDSIATRAARSGGGFTAAGGSPPSPPEGWEELRDRIQTRMDFPSHQPFASATWLGNDGTLWIRLRGPESATQVEWLRVGADGELRGRLILGVQDRLLWSHGDEVWVSEPDDLGVPWLVRYRIEAD